MKVPAVLVAALCIVAAVGGEVVYWLPKFRLPLLALLGAASLLYIRAKFFPVRGLDAAPLSKFSKLLSRRPGTTLRPRTALTVEPAVSMKTSDKHPQPPPADTAADDDKKNA